MLTRYGGDAGASLAFGDGGVGGTGGIGGAGGIGCEAVQSMSNVTVAQRSGAIGGNNLGLSQSADGATSCLQGGTTSPACATSMAEW